MSDSSTEVRLEFDDFIDLQTRLVLLPRIEEEGVEAVVAVYTPKPNTAECNDSNVHNSELKDAEAKEAVKSEESSDKTATTEVSAESDAPTENEQQKDEPEEDQSGEKSETLDTNAADQSMENSPTETPESEVGTHENSIVGMVLTGIATDESDKNHLEDCTGKDFTSILAMIRDAPTPIVLVLRRIQDKVEQHDENESCTEKENVPEDDASLSSSATPEECDVDDKSSSMKSSDWSDRFSSWGSKVRTTSATLAAEAVSSAVSLAAAANEAAERAKASHLAAAALDKTLNKIEKSSQGPRCGMFVQCSAGKFVPLVQQAVSSSSSTSCSSSNPKVTTSSVLLIRESAKEPCPSRGYSFQWYRSYRPLSSSDGSISETCSKDGSKDGSNDGTTEDASVASESSLEWTPLPGAVYAAYQPSATDVGHYLRCVVTIDCVNGRQAGTVDDSYCSEDEETIICSTHSIVSADLDLFSGATQALTRGAKFGNIAGRGNAEGRLFRLHVEISRCTNDETGESDITSALTIFQISGDTAEALHDEPILHVTAISDPARPKNFELVMTASAPPMVAALSTNGRFQLQAPNRITRESLLLALGIANYKGKPVNLNAKTALYPGLLDEVSAGAEGREITPAKRLVGEEVQFFTPREVSSPSSLDGGRESDAVTSDHAKKVEQEFQRLRTKMTRKDKAIADLQRQLTLSDAKVEKMEKALSAAYVEAEARKKEIQDCRFLLRSADRRNDTHNDTIRRLKGDHAKHVSSLDAQVASQSERIAELEKSVRTLQNEKAVLSAAVEARDSKLAKMGDLQTAVDNLSQKVSKGDSLKMELNDMSQRYIEITKEMEKVSNFEKECREELEHTRSTMEDLQKRLAQEKQKSESRKLELESLQIKNQKLQAERNSYKQKADSLSKEVGRLCRHGRTLRDVEKIVADEEARQMEVSLLKAQKRQALEDLHYYRTAYEQTMVAQKQAGLDGDAVKALQQNAELERVISDMTEYVNAKEMQLETLKEVNQALSEELHMLARASMSKNDI